MEETLTLTEVTAMMDGNEKRIAKLKAAYIALREAARTKGLDTAEVDKLVYHMDELCGYEGSI